MGSIETSMGGGAGSGENLESMERIDQRCKGNRRSRSKDRDRRMDRKSRKAEQQVGGGAGSKKGKRLNEL